MAIYETNYAEYNSNDIKYEAMRNILLNAYTHANEDPDLQGRITEAYKELTNIDISANGYEVGSPLPLFLHGMPGHGKTSVVKDAARSVAKLMGMNFVAEPTEFPGSNDFVFVLYETSGMLSTTELGGIPALDTIKRPSDWKEKGLVDKDEKDEYEVLSKKGLTQFVALDQCRMGVIIFDDALNADPTVQNALLSLAEEKKFQSSSIGQHTTAFLTGNLGIDGTYVNEPSPALLNRTESVYIEDNTKDWLKRESDRFGDSLGIAGVNAFLAQCPECFAEKSTSKKGSPSPFASPRSWSKFMVRLRDWMYTYEQSPKKVRLIDLERRAVGILGRAVADKVGGFYHAYTLGASEAAKDFLELGKASPSSASKIEKNYGKAGSSKGTGHGASAQDFGYAFASSLAEIGAYMAIKAFAKDGMDGFDTIMKNYTEGLKIIAMDAPMAGFSINRLQERMVTLIENDESCNIELSDRRTGKTIPIEMRKKMGQEFVQAGVDPDAIASMLTNSNKLSM